ncbi:MAG: 3-methyl-2-oxobutanoate hydroxymethyltransferase [Verrucomicrobiae bacterium]|nr:3-methyl-2-oxobutanoate hydroxymethyltransferase [Verrucomicrobiae bacterium]
MSAPRKKVTAPAIRAAKGSRRRIAALTAADFITARLLDEAGVDVILVGDSLGTTLLGYESTVFVRMADMVHHTAAVARAKPVALVVVDLPFGAYQESPAQAVRSATRLVRAGAEAVKLEGGAAYADRLRAIVDAGIPAMAHLGLLPQSVLREGGYKAQGKTPTDAARLEADLRAVEEAGAFAVVLEYVASTTAQRLTKAAGIPTIGIGSGPDCDGQVLVTSDLLGLQAWLAPRAARRYAELGRTMKDAFACYAADVRAGKFPGLKETIA